MIRFQKALFVGLVVVCAMGGKKASAQSSETFTHLYEPSALKADFSRLFFNLSQGNPGAYRFINSRTLDSAYHAMYNRLEHAENIVHFQMQCDSLVALIRCGHTGIMASNRLYKQMKTDKISQWSMSTVILNNKWVIYKSFLNRNDLFNAGDIIDSVNNIPSVKIIEKTESLLPSDGYSTTSAPIHGSAIISSIFMAAFWDHRDTLKFAVTDTSGRQKLLYIGLSELYQTKKGNINKAPKDTSFVNLFTTKKMKAVPSRKLHMALGGGATLKSPISDSNVVIMSIPIFFSNTRFYHYAFQYITEHKIQKLIIDIRGNPGGQIVDANNLLGYILDSSASIEYRTYNKSLKQFVGLRSKWFYNMMGWAIKHTYPYRDSGILRILSIDDIKPIKQNHYNGKLVVLINGGSFSAACLVASFLKDKRRASFVGRETGGAQYGCNAVLLPRLYFKNTPLVMRMPLYSLLFKVKNNGHGHGIMPDYQVDVNIKSIIKQQDPDIDKALQLLKTQ